MKEKGDIARNEQFLLFPLCFSLIVSINFPAGDFDISYLLIFSFMFFFYRRDKIPAFLLRLTLR